MYNKKNIYHATIPVSAVIVDVCACVDIKSSVGIIYYKDKLKLHT